MSRKLSKTGDIPSTNTHYYDRNISKEILEKIKQFLESSETLSKEDKMGCFNKLRKELTILNTKPDAIGFYDGIINSYVMNDGKNYDPINELDPIDLLYVIYLIYIQNKDLLLLLGEQLEDMKTGFCPKGRTIRLVQIINIFL